jgi:hypothetical protein
MMEHLQKVNKALTNQVKELSHEVEKLKHENVTILKQQESSFIGAKKRAHSLPPSEVPFIKERVKHDSPIMEGNGSVSGREWTLSFLWFHFQFTSCFHFPNVYFLLFTSRSPLPLIHI